MEVLFSFSFSQTQEVDLTNLQTEISGVGYFWTTQKNTLPPTENPKILSDKQNPKKYPQIQKHYSFRKSQAWDDNNRDPWLLKHLVNKTGPKKILLKIWNTLKYSFYLTTQKIQILEIQNPKKYSAEIWQVNPLVSQP